jgi:hypothetical protein
MNRAWSAVITRRGDNVRIICGSPKNWVVRMRPEIAKVNERLKID